MLNWRVKTLQGFRELSAMAIHSKSSGLYFFYLPCILFSLLSTSLANAMWARYTEAELIAQSPLIVVATLQDTMQVNLARENTQLTVGVLRVERVVKQVDGEAAPVFVLLALPRGDGPVSSSDIIYHVGQQGLWFLAPRHGEDTGVYVADHPQRFVPTSAAEPLIGRVLEQATQ